ncbi:MAG: hypothetical protein HY360_13895 [Verrucomicrobia bacterium]|nr:hypothetical protein [Verrucomicrobiota bacterium]
MLILTMLPAMQIASAGEDWLGQWRAATGKLLVSDDRVAGWKSLTAEAGATLALDGQRRWSGDHELRALVRMRTDVSSFAYANFSVGKKDAKEPGLLFLLASRSDSGNINCAVQQDGKPLHNVEKLTEALNWAAQAANSFDYKLRAYGKPGDLYDIFLPATPEDFRRRVETDMARLPERDNKWLEVRIELRNGQVRFWLDGRLVAHKEDPAIRADGFARVELSPGLQLASCAVSPLAAVPKGFAPVHLAGYANARQFLGKASVAALLRSAETGPLHSDTAIETVGEVPFVLSGVNIEGNDHIDVGMSLYRDANKDEYVPAFYQPWAGSAWRDPARIQLRVPNKQYNTLYLLAAADNDRDEIPVVTAMFFRPTAGFSEQFAATVPLATAKSSDATPFPVTLSDGREVNLWLVKIPLDPGKLSSFADLDIVELELTKKVYLFRSYPDPIVSGWHQGGRASSVHVFAVTLGEAPVGFDFQPTRFGHVWTSPEVPGYTAALTNHTESDQPGTLTVTTRSFDGTEETRQQKAVSVAQGASANVALSVPVKLNGYHEITATLDIAGKRWTEKRSFVRLAPDTRSVTWTEGKGALFGFWSYQGAAHHTPKAEPSVNLMTVAGARTTLAYAFGLDPWPKYARLSPTNELIQKHWTRINGPIEGGRAPDWAKDLAPDPKKVAEFQNELLKAQSYKDRIPERFRPDHLCLFAEPFVSMRLTSGNYPEYWGEPPYELTPGEQERIRMHLSMGKYAAEAVRKHWPDLKILIPHGDPLFCVPLLRAGFPTNLIDGVGIDYPNFARLPEQQLHQASIHRFYMMRKEFEKAGIPNPLLYFVEGVFVPTEPGACSWRKQMDIYGRCMLLGMAYGVTRFYSCMQEFDNCSWYGAEQYGGNGIFRRVPYCDPKPAFASYATMTERLNEANFDGWLKTGSLTTYCLRFKGPRGNVYSLWTVRGKRPVTLTLAADAEVQVADAMNNTRAIQSKNRKVEIVTDPSVVYLTTTAEVVAVEAGEPKHPDAAPPPNALQVADLGDGSWKYTSCPDLLYENNNFDTFRYLGEFSSAVVADPQHGKVLGSKIEKQRKVHELMPWYNTLTPPVPIALKGAPSHIGLWVKGASDWGRIVYCLRDAQGERWISVGTKDQWNCNDMHGWSMFNFDGWRYLRFEMPGHLGYDSFRRQGTTWWGAQDGDSVVDLPLKLEQIIVEQRSHILYVNDVQPAASDTVCFGKLHLEYDNAEDATDEAIRISRLRMPPPQERADLPNPITELEKNGIGAPPEIIRFVAPGLSWYAWNVPGSQWQVDCKEIPGAKKYFLWMSAYPDGRGAINLTPAGFKPGEVVGGMRPSVKLFFWTTYQDEKGQMSKPSPVFGRDPITTNPIERLAKEGVGQPSAIVRLRPPDFEPDGTKVHVEVKEIPGAKRYFLWVGTQADGRDAVNTTLNGFQPGALVRGLRPRMKLCFWVTYEDAEGHWSRPSAAHVETLVDMFKEK